MSSVNDIFSQIDSWSNNANASMIQLKSFTLNELLDKCQRIKYADVGLINNLSSDMTIYEFKKLVNDCSDKEYKITIKCNKGYWDSDYFNSVLDNCDIIYPNDVLKYYKEPNIHNRITLIQFPPVNNDKLFDVVFILDNGLSSEDSFVIGVNLSGVK